MNVGKVCEAAGRMKEGKAARIDWVIRTLMFRAGGDTVLEWLACLFNVQYTRKKGRWQRIGREREYKNYRGIILLSTPGKFYGILIRYTRERTLLICNLHSLFSDVFFLFFFDFSLFLTQERLIQSASEFQCTVTRARFLEQWASFVHEQN